MAVNFHTKKTQILESVGIKVLNELGITVKANNKENINDPDFLLKPGVFIDFQYSNHFRKYGDIRIDTISAYQTNTKSRIQLQQEIRESVKQSAYPSLFPFLEQFMQIKKRGKYFEPNKIIAIIYFLYNFEFKTNRRLHQPDHILLLAVTSIKKYINDNWKTLLAEGALKLNDKSGLGDRHGSAFICFPFNKITDEFCLSSLQCFTPFSLSVPFHIDKKLRYLIVPEFQKIVKGETIINKPRSTRRI